MRRIVAALALSALVLAGCGGDDDEPAADDATETTAADESGDETTAPDEGSTDAPAGEGECPYLTTAALDEAFGTTFEELAGNETACSFTDGADLSIQVSRIDIAIDPGVYAEESTSTCEEGSVVEVDAGDAAYACIAIGPTAAVIEGDVLINLGVLSADDEQAVVDAFATVLPQVTFP